MDDLRQELNELKDFIGDLKADRAATKEKEKRENWTKYVSLTVVIIAVLASVASQWGGKYGSRTQMSQAQASDAWSAYQSQSVKEHIYDSTRKVLPRTAADPETVAQQKVFEEKIADYDKKKADWSVKAQGFEKTRDQSSQKGGFMGTSVAFYSISIAMASTCLVTKKKPLWFLAMALAFLGLGEMIFAWVL
jgi:Tfp pilus assembly protein PilE